MGNLWPAEFKEAEIKTPKEIIEEQIKNLPKLTGDMVYAELVPVKLSGCDFAYRFRIRGKFLESYSFLAFTVSHSLVVYPITMDVDTEICEELGLGLDIEIDLDTEEGFLNLFENILKSQRLRKVIEMIMKISK